MITALHRWLQTRVVTLTERVTKAGNRAEVEQGTLRIVIAFVVMCYLTIYALRDGSVSQSEFHVLLVAAGFFLFSVALVGRTLARPHVSPLRRMVGMLADNGVTTYCLLNMGEGGAVVIGVYLFITFGNGFRYGRRYLHMCQAMAIAGFTSVLVYSEFWSQHTAIGSGFLIGLIVLPLYVGVLAERVEKAKKRADEANQAKSRFVANVSHEMRTPLNGVIAMADVLRETNLSESQREIVDTMNTSAQLLLAQIEDVLDVEKIEAGRVHIEVRPFEFARLVSSTVKVVLPQARYKGLDMRTELDPAAAGWFQGDPHHLRQVLLNLLSNAVKFTERGQVSVHVRVMASDDARRTLRVEVRDTGIGIAPEKQALIFEPFAQADDSITRVYGGTGLGTTIARNLIKLMGGTIGLESAAGAGSVFWFEVALPVAAPQGIDLTEDLVVSARHATTAQSLQQSLNVRKLRGARILVAEDNPTNQRVAQLILQSGGHVVTLVDNGEEALDALERGGYDIALFDLSMPVISGLEALKLYRFSVARPIPVLVLSANVTTDIIAECNAAGAAEFIPKPLRASYLLEAIDRYLVIADDGRASDNVPPPRTDERPALTVVDTPPLDADALHDLERLSPDPTFIDRLLEGFLADATRLTAQISEALAQRKYDAIRDAAHALKGGAASVGATHLTQFAARIEGLPPETLRLRAAPITEDMLATFARTREALDAFRSARANARGATPTA
ncbi:MAG: response regulator [Proteobacteria bacterium]|nr:response regulator [Pseudomonadota bacterium]